MEAGDALAARLEGLFEASMYELKGKDLEVTYVQVFAGVPDLEVNGKHYSGTQVRVDRDAELGRIVTVTTEIVFDGYQTTLSVLLPGVNFGDTAERPIRTVAIQVQHLSHIGGPTFIDGQMSNYKSIALRGKARRIRG